MSATIHDANAGTLGQFGGWHWWCSCGEKGNAVDEKAAEMKVFCHLDASDPERAQRYAIEKGYAVSTLRAILDRCPRCGGKTTGNPLTLKCTVCGWTRFGDVGH